MKTIQLQSEVGKDGVLDVRVLLGPEEAGNRVVVTIGPTTASPPASANREDWHLFIEQTYGSCAGLGLERPDQGEFETRESIE